MNERMIVFDRLHDLKDGTILLNRAEWVVESQSGAHMPLVMTFGPTDILELQLVAARGYALGVLRIFAESLEREQKRVQEQAAKGDYHLFADVVLYSDELVRRSFKFGIWSAAVMDDFQRVKTYTIGGETALEGHVHWQRNFAHGW